MIVSISLFSRIIVIFRLNSFKFDFGFQNQLDFFLSEAPELNYQDNLLDEINTMELTFDLVEELST